VKRVTDPTAVKLLVKPATGADPENVITTSGVGVSFAMLKTSSPQEQHT
jgi:hypothetical protein